MNGKSKESCRLCNFAVPTFDFEKYVESGSLEAPLHVPIIQMSSSKNSGLKSCYNPCAYYTPSEAAAAIEEGELRTVNPGFCRMQRIVNQCPEAIAFKPAEDIFPLQTAIAQASKDSF